MIPNSPYCKVIGGGRGLSLKGEMMIDRNKYESLVDALADVDDLEAVKRALIREQVIRETMRNSGEDRKTITDMIEAMDSTDRETVLDLTEGEPTTLRDALDRLVDELNGYEEETGDLRTVADQLSALLAYPWPD